MEHVAFVDRSGWRHYRHPDGRPFLDPARYRVTLITLPEKAAEAREVDRVIETNVLDPQAIRDVIPLLSDVDRVVTVGERFMVPAAEIREALGVPGFTVEQITVFRDKCAMKKHFRACGIRTPEFIRIDRPLDAVDLLERHGTIICKPVASMGSVGVHKVRSRAELEALEVTGFDEDGPYEAEQFIDGQLFHVDSLVHHGRPAVASVSRYLDNNYRFEVGGRCRAVQEQPGPVRNAILAFNERLLASVDWYSGATHLEVFVGNDGGVVLCEIAARPCGAGVVPAFRYQYGVDLNWATMAPQLGLPVPPIEVREPAEVTGYSVIYTPTVGTLASYDEVPRHDWLVDFTLTRQPGVTLVPPRSWGQSVAVATVRGPDLATVTARLNQAKTELALTVEAT